MKRVSCYGIVVLALAALLLAPGGALADIPWPGPDLWWVTTEPGKWRVEWNGTGQEVQLPVWERGGLDLWVYNVAQPEYTKTVWLEVQWDGPVQEALNPNITYPCGGVTLLDHFVSGSTSTWKWQIWPQPEREVITFANLNARNMTGIKAIHVATLCVPEPGSILVTVALFSQAGFVFLRRRR